MFTIINLKHLVVFILTLSRSLWPTINHAPLEMIRLVSNLNDGLTAVISTSKWTTAPIHLQLGIYQGEPLSAIIFNTVMD